MFRSFSTRFERFDHRAMLAIARRRHPVLTKFLQILTITGEGRAWLTYEHPLRPGLALAGEVSLEVRYRSGTIRTTTRSDTETRQFATLGLVF